MEIPVVLTKLPDPLRVSHPLVTRWHIEQVAYQWPSAWSWRETGGLQVGFEQIDSGQPEENEGESDGVHDGSVTQEKSSSSMHRGLLFMQVIALTQH